jgi:hypothetical protein
MLLDLSLPRHVMGLRNKTISAFGTTEKSALMTESKKVAMLIEISDINMFKDKEKTFIPKKTGKGKAIPLQAWTVPEGSRGLRLPDFKTIGIYMVHSSFKVS